MRLSVLGLKQEIGRRGVGFGVGAGLFTIGFDVADLFGPFKWIILLLSLATCVAAWIFLNRQMATAGTQGTSDSPQSAPTSDTAPTVLLGGLGAFFSTLILILIDLLNPNNTASQVSSINAAVLGGQLSQALSFTHLPDAQAGENVRAYALTWRGPLQPTNCKTAKNAAENIYLKVDIQSCDRLDVTIKPAATPEDPQKALETINNMGVVLQTQAPKMSVRAQGQQVDVGLQFLAFDIVQYLSKVNAKVYQDDALAKLSVQHQRQTRLPPARHFVRHARCGIGGCSFRFPLPLGSDGLCSTDAKTLAVRHPDLKDGVEFPLDPWCQAGVTYNTARPLCLGLPGFVGQLDPGSAVKVTLLDSSGGALVDYEVPVVEPSTPSQSRGLWRSAPQAVSAPADQTAPYMDFQISASGPVVRIHATRCDPGMRTLIDPDGQGLTALQNVSVGRSVPVGGHFPAMRGIALSGLPEGDIKIGFDLSDGRRLGPYRYSADWESLFRKALAEVSLPQLNCVRAQRRCYPATNGDGRIAWLAVQLLQFGASGATLDETIEAEALQQAIEDSQDMVERFSFGLQPGQTDVYYQVTMRDGRTLPAQRIAIDSLPY